MQSVTVYLPRPQRVDTEADFSSPQPPSSFYWVLLNKENFIEKHILMKYKLFCM